MTMSWRWPATAAASRPLHRAGRMATKKPPTTSSSPTPTCTVASIATSTPPDFPCRTALTSHAPQSPLQPPAAPSCPQHALPAPFRSPHPSVACSRQSSAPPHAACNGALVHVPLPVFEGSALENVLQQGPELIARAPPALLPAAPSSTQQVCYRHDIGTTACAAFGTQINIRRP